MTAIVIVSQPRFGCVHIGTDAAIYREHEGVVAFGNKVVPIAHLSAAITGAGNASAGALLGRSFGCEFTSWDDVVERAPAVLPMLTKSYGLPNGAVMILAGISKKRGAEAYSFSLDDSLPPDTTRAEMEASEYHAAPFQFVKLPDHVNTPVPPAEIIQAANFEGFDADEDPDVVRWSILKLLTMQRAMPLPDGIGGIGGFAEITTVSESEITQRIVKRWPDKIGAPLRPEPIDWSRWCAQNPKPKTRRPALRVV